MLFARASLKPAIRAPERSPGADTIGCYPVLFARASLKRRSYRPQKQLGPTHEVTPCFLRGPH